LLRSLWLQRLHQTIDLGELHIGTARETLNRLFKRPLIAQAVKLIEVRASTEAARVGDAYAASLLQVGKRLRGLDVGIRVFEFDDDAAD
jgi:hypothetical protein